METKSAFIAVVGRPNVGKSSFINAAVKNKVAIVSSKPQTTRTRIMGVLTEEVDQLVFVDTPGFHKPRNILGEQMVKATKLGLSDVEAVLLIADAAPTFKLNEVPAAEQELLKEISKRKLPVILALNKIDKLEDKSDLLSVISLYKDYYDFVSIHPISVKELNGTDDLIKELKSFCKDSVHYFPKDCSSDQPEKVMISEIIREKILYLYDKEIPHGTAVDIERFFETDLKNNEPLLNVEATIYCEKESHKGIIIGKKGAALKKVGTLARADIEEFFGVKTSLKLWVKVKEDWRNRGGLIHTFGLD